MTVESTCSTAAATYGSGSLSHPIFTSCRFNGLNNSKRLNLFHEIVSWIDPNEYDLQGFYKIISKDPALEKLMKSTITKLLKRAMYGSVELPFACSITNDMICKDFPPFPTTPPETEIDLSAHLNSKTGEPLHPLSLRSRMPMFAVSYPDIAPEFKGNCRLISFIRPEHTNWVGMRIFVRVLEEYPRSAPSGPLGQRPPKITAIYIESIHLPGLHRFRYIAMLNSEAGASEPQCFGFGSLDKLELAKRMKDKKSEFRTTLQRLRQIGSSSAQPPATKSKK